MTGKSARRVCIVGTGGIGSRHLQALAGLPAGYEIWAVDPSAASRERAAGIYRDTATEASPEVHWAETVRNGLPERLDVAILATNSNVRLATLADLLDQCRVEHLILEKFLFCSMAEFDRADALLSSAVRTSWVNCPMRLWPVYQLPDLAALREGAGEMTVVGSAWGLASNAIHYLDLFAHLCHSPISSVDLKHLMPQPVTSKRPGFLELRGTLLGTTERGDRISLSDFGAGDAPVRTILASGGVALYYDETSGAARWSASSGNWEEHTAVLPQLFQSRLSDRLVQDLAEDGTCALPAYAESARLHRMIIAAVLADDRLWALAAEGVLRIT